MVLVTSLYKQISSVILHVPVSQYLGVVVGSETLLL